MLIIFVILFALGFQFLSKSNSNGHILKNILYDFKIKYTIEILLRK